MGRRRRSPPRSSDTGVGEEIVEHAPVGVPAGAGPDRHYRSWTDDDWRRAERSRRFAWAIATIAIGCLALSMVAVVVLASWQTVTPIIVRVSELGVVDVVTELEAKRFPASEAVDRYFLGRYVRLREQRLGESADAHAAQVVGWMTGGAERERLTAVLRGRGDAPARTEIAVTAVTFLRRGDYEGTATVRFGKRIAETANEAWVATLEYAYLSSAGMSTEARLENPLGFGVLQYSASREIGQ